MSTASDQHPQTLGDSFLRLAILLLGSTSLSVELAASTPFETTLRSVNRNTYDLCEDRLFKITDRTIRRRQFLVRAGHFPQNWQLAYFILPTDLDIKASAPQTLS